MNSETLKYGIIENKTKYGIINKIWIKWLVIRALKLFDTKYEGLHLMNSLVHFMVMVCLSGVTMLHAKGINVIRYNNYRQKTYFWRRKDM